MSIKCFGNNFLPSFFLPNELRPVESVAVGQILKYGNSYLSAAEQKLESGWLGAASSPRISLGGKPGPSPPRKIFLRKLR